jgi:hypothetical protein
MPDAPAPSNDPIDAVYTWQDGDDPKLQEQIRKYREVAGGVLPDSSGPPFSDSQRLRFSLRSLERNAPWIRNVYLVTNGQTPNWIVTGNPRLTVVRHEDLFKDRTVLPTFNPAAIEWQLFRIPGLSRRFLYLHDSFFLGQPVTLGDFVNAKGGTRVLVEATDIPSTDASQVLTQRLLSARVGDHSPRKMLARTPRLIDKTLLEEVHRLWEGQIKRTALHQFPHPEDVSLETLYFYFLLESPMQYGVHEQVAAAAESKGYLRLELSPRTGWMQLLSIAFSRPKFLSLGEGSETVNEKTAAGIRGKVRRFLWLCFWRRSGFEAK